MDGTLGDCIGPNPPSIADLFLRSIPTAVLFLLLLAAYRLLVHRPLLKVLAERRERTSGAMARAEAAIRTAERATQEYEARLRAARAEIFHAREQRVQAMQRERDRVLEEARHSAHETVRAARERLDAEATAARATLDSRQTRWQRRFYGSSYPRPAV